jgi:hypothetical protein
MNVRWTCCLSTSRLSFLERGSLAPLTLLKVLRLAERLRRLRLPPLAALDGAFASEADCVLESHLLSTMMKFFQQSDRQSCSVLTSINLSSV